MNKFLLFIALLSCPSLMAQVNLNTCIDSALANRPNIKTARENILLAGLKTADSRSKYLPQLNIAYDYFFNPIIATQVVPVGQFNSVPTDETRPIQFGTNWQQNAGLTLYQPIIDLPLRNRIRESRINETISTLDLKVAEEELRYQVIDTYLRILQLEQVLGESIADTLRTYASYAMVRRQFDEGKILKTVLNNALVNHHANLRKLASTIKDLVTEKIFLHYLTGINADRLLQENYAPVPAGMLEADMEATSISWDSLTAYQLLSWQEKLISQQIRTEQTINLPTIGFKGFLGANQFNQQFNPFEANTWFGTSYLGLSLRLPLFDPSKSVNSRQQLAIKARELNNKKQEFREETFRKYREAGVEITQKEQEISLLRTDLAILSENLAIYRERAANGQYMINEINVQEAEYQKYTSQLKQLENDLMRARLKRLKETGQLNILRGE